jgi:hypothetical protein
VKNACTADVDDDKMRKEEKRRKEVKRKKNKGKIVTDKQKGQ